MNPRDIALDVAGVICVAGMVGVAILHGVTDPAFAALGVASGAYLTGRAAGVVAGTKGAP